MRRLRSAAAVPVLVASLLVASLLTVATSHATTPAAAAAAITRSEVAFSVTNPVDPGHTYTVRGTLIRPQGCTSSVLLAEHGLSYGRWAWDFPLDPEHYSMAQGLAERGHAMVAIDELGYGASDHPNGYSLTVQAYAAMTDQIIRQLRSGGYTTVGGPSPSFGRVGLIGHSAGSEIVELAEGTFHDADALIVTAYEHTPAGVSPEWLAREWIPGDNVRAASKDYEYFETDPQTRAQDMYNLERADPAVVARDTAMANLTPSGEVYSIGLQPSRSVIGTISVPVLIVLAEDDAIFPPTGAEAELALFADATDRSMHEVFRTGHALPLHRSAPFTTGIIGSWLTGHPAAMPAC